MCKLYVNFEVTLKSIQMKYILQLTAALTLGLFMTSCSNNELFIIDSETQDFMNEKTFDVTSFEFYDHATLENYDSSDEYDHMYFTINGSNGFISKVDQTTDLERQPSYSWDRVEMNFEGGVLQGIWIDKYTYMSAVSYDREGNRIALELEGAHELHKQFQSIFIVMTALDFHPNGIAEISGLSE